MNPQAEPQLACLLLAAGGSERLGRPKQLLRVEGESLICRSARLLRSLSAEVIVVTGAFASEIEADLGGIPVLLAHNQAWQSGMGGSIAMGMREISETVDGVLILLCDQWKIDSKDLQNLCNAWRQVPGSVVTSSWAEHTGPPVIFPASQFDDLRRLQGERGAKGLVTGQMDIRKVNIPNAQFDLDTEDDLRIMLASPEMRDSE